MDQLRRMAIFATVIARGSMRAAARELGLTPSAVSQQVRALELALGVSLLHRSTRRLALTEAGARYHAGCAAMLAAARSAEEALAALRDAPEGELRISAPVGFARLIAQALGPLLEEHPRLKLHLHLDDAATDLIGERIDLALRVGEWPDSSLVARRLGSLPVVLVGAPQYLARRGWPAQPEDLAAHDWLLGRRSRPARAIVLHGPGGRTFDATLDPRVESNNHQSLRQMAVSGLGLTGLPVADIAEDLAAGRLLQVLASWRPAAFPVYAVTPGRDALPAKVRHALAAFQQALPPSEAADAAS